MNITEKPLEKKPLEILVERTGKISEKPEVYSSKHQFLIMFPNNYSVLLSDNHSRKHAKIQVYWGVGEVTNSFFPNKTNRKVHRTIALSLMEKIESFEDKSPNE